MKRRNFLILGTASLLVPQAVWAGTMRYRPGLAREELAAGKTVFLDFKASWCPTCAAQGRVIAALKAENPAYERQISFIDVDWDNYGNGELSRSLNIPRRSTLVVLKGEQELGRIVAGTKRRVIRELMDIALAAAIA
ncbi:MAG: thioredoxin family protein [Paracoccaceae bacterium]